MSTTTRAARRSLHRFLATFMFAAIATLLPSAASAQHGDVEAMKAALTASAAAWNANDLEGHVAMYSDTAAMMGGNGPVRGRDRVKAMLGGGFWRDGKPLQQLRFEEIAVRLVGHSAAVTTGKFILTGGGRPDLTGRFTTVWAKEGDTWRVMHDHSS